LRSGSKSPDEVIVVDGADDPVCAALCHDIHCIYLRSQPGRGRQLHAGAGRAGGEVVWFLHADAHPDSNSIPLIHAAIHNGAAGGYFRFRFTGRPAWHKRLLSGLINLRTTIGIPYGDQGLFLHREVYTAIGGFPDMPLFEEVPLVKAARQAGNFVRLPADIGVSPRRWERDGWMRRTLTNRTLAFGYFIGIPPTTLARRYPANQPRIDQTLAEKS
jgi:hypothetical protein